MDHTANNAGRDKKPNKASEDRESTTSLVSGVPSGLQPGGTIPDGGPGAGSGSLGTGGGSTGGEPTGNAR